MKSRSLRQERGNSIGEIKNQGAIALEKSLENTQRGIKGSFVRRGKRRIHTGLRSIERKDREQRLVEKGTVYIGCRKRKD